MNLNRDWLSDSVLLVDSEQSLIDDIGSEAAETLRSPASARAYAAIGRPGAGHHESVIEPPGPQFW